MSERAPESIQLIGDEVALRWPDGSESYIAAEKLRAASPSAENKGETDLLGRHIGGGDGTGDFAGVRVSGWEMVGGYAVQFRFSDGHNTGLYPFALLRELGG